MALKQRLHRLEKTMPPAEAEKVTEIFFVDGTGDPNRPGEVWFVENLLLGKKIVRNEGETEDAFLGYRQGRTPLSEPRHGVPHRC